MTILLNLIENKELKIEKMEYDSFITLLMIVIRGEFLGVKFKKEYY